MTLLHRIAVALTAAYGLIALVGGLIGYLKAGSIASLIAGGGSGLLLLVCAALARQKPPVGLIGAMVVSFLLVARFLNSAIGQGALALVPAVMIVGGAAVLVAAGLALKERR
jgi:uncharacterized membrane protein (UPF0136 family)